MGQEIKRLLPDEVISSWQYYYYGNGMMSKVIRPDNTVISFKYDSLGRRIEKKTPERTKHFVWDGNKPLHEWEDENLITWVFDDGYAPVAKLTAQGNYSIIADHLGTPAEAYDADGNCVWSAELDIFGRVKEFTGEVDFIPFRYQGQYNDLETGLYYNRFRYYSPEEGGYTQPDPIGLAGKNPTLYGYVWDPNWLVDIFGLSPLRDSLINAGQGLSVPWQAHHAIPNQVWNENLSFFNRIGFTGQHSVSNGLALPVSQTGAIQTGHSYFHSGPHANYSADIRHQVGDVRLRYENALRGGTDPKNAAQNAVRDLNTVQSRAKNNLGTRNGGNPCRLS